MYEAAASDALSHNTRRIMLGVIAAGKRARPRTTATRSLAVTMETCTYGADVIRDHAATAHVHTAQKTDHAQHASQRTRRIGWLHKREQLSRMMDGRGKFTMKNARTVTMRQEVE